VRTGALIGDSRVSTSGQLLDRQQHVLVDAGLPPHLRRQAVRQERRPVRRHPGRAKLGPAVPVPADLIVIVTTLRRQGAGFKSLHEAVDTTTPSGRLVFHVFAALAEFVGELIIEGARLGQYAACARGVRLGRPSP
jgi:Resolvase, N terminal domain